MNIAGFIDKLSFEISKASSASAARMIQFHNTEHFQRFIEMWHKCAESIDDTKLKIMHSAQAVSCRIDDWRWMALFAQHIGMEQDNAVQLAAVPSTISTAMPGKGLPWGVKQVKAPQAWKKTIGSQIRIGVVDTGVDFNHPDLRGKLLHGVNLIHTNRLPVDDNGHGTHIAGIIAAGSRTRGMTGVAPGAMLAPIKAFDHNGSAFVSDIILAIEWCIANKMNIINMSFGMRKRNKALLNAVTNASQAGIIIVASSGNDGKQRTIDYPARYTHTIAVGATAKMRKIAPFSNRGAAIDIYAPGDKIVSAWPQGNYNEMSGTSMATSHVSGAIALLLSLYPKLTPYQIKSIIKRSIQPLRNYKARRTIGELDISRMLHLADQY